MATLRPVLTSLTLLSTLVLCQVASAKDWEQKAPEGYRPLVRKALEHVDEKRWAEATALFERAHAMFPNARTLRGLAIVNFEARRYVEALRFGRESLANKVRPLTDDQREYLEELVEQADAFVGRYTIQVTPEGAELWVDGHPAALTDGVLLLDPGAHEIVARAPKHTELSRSVRVQAGQSGEFRLDLVPTQAAARAAEANTEPTPEPQPTHQTRSEQRPRLWTWVAAGASAAFAIAAVGIYASALSERDDIADTCRGMQGGACTPMERDQLLDDSDIGLKETLTTTGIVLSAAGAVGAGVLFYLEGRPAEAESEAAATTIGVLPGAIAVTGRF